MKSNRIRVPFLDLSPIHQPLEEQFAEVLERVVAKSTFVLGELVEEFEHAWAEYCGVKHAVGVGNGLDALHLSLRAVGVQPGDEVLVPANTFIATWLAVVMCGAVPVPVEPDPTTLNISAIHARELVGEKTKAVVAVHLYGHPAELDELSTLCTEYGLFLLEDAAQAHGAVYKGKRIGGHSSAAAWSFYPGKNLGALGDGGAVTTNDSALADTIRMMRNYGSKLKYHHVGLGFNSRLDEIQAGFLLKKLPLLDYWNQRRFEIAAEYSHALKNFISPSLSPEKIQLLSIPHEVPYAQSAWHLYVLRVSNRDQFRKFLSLSEIETGIHYPIPPAAQQMVFGDSSSDWSSFSHVSSAQLVSLPIGPHLSDNDVEHVIGTMEQCLST